MKGFSEPFFTWFVPDELQNYIIPKQTSNNARAESPNIRSKRGYDNLIG